MPRLPNGLISFGKNANCTLELCPVEASILKYQPSVSGNAVVICLFAVAMAMHLYQGVRWRTWSFTISIVVGCLDEILGYVGRIMLHNNPFSFTPFVIQTVCITTAPIFFCSAIYVVLSRSIIYLDRSVSRFNPRLFIWIFLPSDVISLILQALGGALSSTQAGTGNKSGVKISQAGLIFQVVTLVIFCALFIDYVVRFHRKSTSQVFSTRVAIFISFLFLSVLFILARCAFRIDELADGYDGPLIHDEVLFMALEAGMMIVAVLCLNVAHPGFAFGRTQSNSLAKNGETGVDLASTADLGSDGRKHAPTEWGHA